MIENKYIVIAMDGGAASGKSTTARMLAEKAHLLYVDTGAHYRSITCALVEFNSLDKIKLGTRIEGRSALLEINGKVYEKESLRAPEVNERVSHVAAREDVRKFLLEYQRSLVGFGSELGYKGIVMEGRDIGSVVLPEADYRYFLEADAETRLRRRADQGESDSIEKRDKMDASRKAAPLVCPEGARRIDSSHMTLNEVVEIIYGEIQDGE